MYIQRIIHFPALGKNAVLRAALEERHATAGAKAPHALYVSMFTPQPAYIHALRFQTLADIETYQEANQGDPAFQAIGRKITACLSAPQQMQLLDRLVATGLSATPKYQIRLRYSPAPGKGPELRAALEQRLQQAHPGKIGGNLAVTVTSVDGPAFISTVTFANMAGIDAWRASLAKDPNTPEFGRQLAALTAAPVQSRMLRVLAPFPAV